MNESFQQLFQSDPLQASGALGLFLVLYLISLLLAGGAVYLIYFLFTLPMRRNERARLLLDLLELGLKDGRTPEAAIVDAASSHDRSLGVRFHLLAAHLEQGMRLSQALEKVPRLVPPQVAAMLKTGERIGDIAKVLPGCRQFLNDGVSHVRGAANYMILLAFAVTPLMVLVPLMIRVQVIPKFKEVFATMLEGQPLPAFTRLIFAESSLLTLVQVGIVCFFWLAMVAYVGGPRLYAWLHRLAPGLSDQLCCRLPWRRKRYQRDFSAMLAVLLDGAVPETEAVGLAGASTGNLAIGHRAGRVQNLLNDGVKLPEAMRAMDDTGELRWRLSNALHGRGGFLRALTGWHEALDAKAFQLEQSAAQITTTTLVLLNGLIVGSIVIGLFLLLIQLLNQAVLW
jgi:type IV pilus assembly protein PilC